MKNRGVLLALMLTSSVAAFAQDSAPPPTSAAEGEDRYLWLEDIQGARALEQVDRWNLETETLLAKAREYPIAKAWAKQILDDDRQIALPASILGGRVTTLWRDADHPRGLWQIADLADYVAGKPQWRVLIDVDKLGRDDGQSYVWHGADCLAPAYKRCLVSLSPGGTDADIVREFDLDSGAFVEGGFSLPQAKSNVSWFDADTLFVGTDEGAGSLTDSGYPRLVRQWKRGTAFTDAPLLSEGQASDISVSGFSILDGARRWQFIRRSPTFWTSQISLISAEGKIIPLSIPEDAEFEAVLAGQLVVKLNSAMGANGPGTLISYPLREIEAGRKPAPALVFRPGRTQAVEEVAASEGSLWVKVLDDVSGRLLEIVPDARGWTSRMMELPDNSTLTIVGTSSVGDTAFVSVESMLSPKSLYAVPADGPARLVASEPAQFDASKFTVQQYFATSNDGTRVPYYLVRPKGAQGPLPTLVHAYGGFRNAQTPKYLTAEPYRSGPLSLFWLEEGNAYALANIRGGGEYGPRWHEDALREKRQNSFDDLHAVAQDLVNNELSAAKKIAISGRSNGGVLVGAAANQRPDLYGAVISGSPLDDMKRYNKLLAGASWVDEYGNPDVPADWAFMKSWSPYQNLKPIPDQPAVFYYLSTLDDRVHPGHARKMAAKGKEFGQTVYYHEYKEGGHAVGADHEEDAKRAALLLAFLNREIGQVED